MTVPAGTFEAYKIELASPDDATTATLRIGKESRRLLKSTATGPQLNGADVTAELAE